MKMSIDILNELNEISPVLAKLERVNVFEVPNGYFDTISESITALVIEPTPSFLGDKVQPNFSVPLGYFESLSDQILQKIKVAETDETSYLDTQSKAMPFSIPENYFDNLSEEILAKVNAPKGKVIAFPTFVRYAVAALLIGVMAFGISYFVEKRNNTAGNQIASLDATIKTGIQMNDQQFAKALENLTEEDIATYLAKNSNDKDLSIFENSIDVADLPTQEEYLFNEKLLEL